MAQQIIAHLVMPVDDADRAIGDLLCNNLLTMDDPSSKWRIETASFDQFQHTTQHFVTRASAANRLLQGKNQQNKSLLSSDEGFFFLIDSLKEGAPLLPHHVYMPQTWCLRVQFEKDGTNGMNVDDQDILEELRAYIRGIVSATRTQVLQHAQAIKLVQ